MQPRSHNQTGSPRRRPLAPAAARAGFTLVEMLVSVALVVLMMTMFATVFQLAAGSVSTQRGMAENDQRARSLTTVILSDLGEFVRDPETESRVVTRTFKSVIPFEAGEMPPAAGDPDFALRDFKRREGYFYISENDINNDADDVLQFTVAFSATSGELYYGKAAQLFDLATDGTTFATSNEPDRDDGYPTPDGASDSNAAEVCYFLRDGRLYRRVLLLRHPFSTEAVDVQPTDSPIDDRVNYFDPANDGEDGLPFPYTGNFWNDFDFSAHSGLQFDTDGSITANNGVVFHGVSYLNNGNVAASFTEPVLANPQNRFGHNHDTGQPREFASDGSFIGRFTHEETSFFNDADGDGQIDAGEDVFGYPQFAAVIGGTKVNPMDPATPLTVTNGIVTQFADGTPLAGGPRRAEDLLLSNVHAFDVKVWDELIDNDGDGVPEGDFVDVGHDRENSSGSPMGDYNQAKNQHVNASPPIVYGPSTTAANNRVYDTWYHQLDVDDDGSANANPPPFRPMNGSTPKPLKAIRITIRYLDISSDQMRQLTLDISLTE